MDSCDEYLLLNIFERLNFDDLMSVARTCTKYEHVADRLFMKYSNFELSNKIVRRGNAYIERVLYYTGHYVSSLTIRNDNIYICSRLMDWIECKNVENLIIDARSVECQDVLSSYSFDNLKLLTVCYWSSVLPRSFLQAFHKLKCLNFVYCNIEFNDLRMLFQNNPNIESFVFRSYGKTNFDCKLLELLPKVEKLSLSVDTEGNIFNLNSLLTLHQLTKL